jgi:NADH-quinone oxidoreductase subunit G
VGSNIYLHTRGRLVMRVLPKENEAVNETWLSDRDRFAYTALDSDQRLAVPMIKTHGRWEETDWETALNAAVAGIKQVLTRAGAGQVGALASPSATVEELFLLQKLLRALGSPNIDHRLRQRDFSDQDAAPAYPSLGMPLEALQDLDGVLLVGANVRKDQPLIGHRIRKAAMAGGKVGVINAVDYEFRFPVAAKLITGLAGMERALAGIVKVLLEGSGSLSPAMTQLLADVQPDATQRAMAELLRRGERSAVLLGNQAEAHPASATLRALGAMIAELSESRSGFVTAGANAAGAWMAGALPHRGPGGRPVERQGHNARAMLEAKLKAYILLGVEPELDCADSAAALAALRQAECVVVMTSFVSDAMKDHADVLLPVSAFSETSGTYVNAEGRWQSFPGAVAPLGEARPAWKVLRVLGNLFGAAGFDYLSSGEVRDEAARAAAHLKPDNRADWPQPKSLSAASALVRLADVPLYAADGIVRRAEPLQHTEDAMAAAVYCHERTAAKLGAKNGATVKVRQGGEVTLPLVIDNRVAEGCVWIPAGTPGSVGLGAHGESVEFSVVAS